MCKISEEKNSDFKGEYGYWQKGGPLLVALETPCQEKRQESLRWLDCVMATPATAVVYRVNEKEKILRRNLKKETMFLLSGCCGLSFMSFEARDVVAVIYSFHYQDFTTLLVPDRPYTDLHTFEITVGACTEGIAVR